MATFKEANAKEDNIGDIQELYVGESILAHLAYNIRRGTVGKRKEQSGAIRITVSTRERLIMEARIDIIDHPYITVLNVWEQEKEGGKRKRRTRVANIYDNNLSANQVWNLTGRNTRRKALADVEWERIVEGSTVLLGNFNACSTQENVRYRERKDSTGLETLIENHNYICNNELVRATRPTRGQTTSIIHLNFTTTKLRALDSSIIDE